MEKKMAIKILTDSGSDINQLEADKMGIHLMPIPITFGETEYLDGVNLMPTEFYDLLEKSDELPVTSQITPYKYEKVFEKLTANGDKLIVEHWSGNQIQDNKIYVFCFNNEFFVKRLCKNLDEIIIKSENPEYRTKTIGGATINELVPIGKIVGVIKTIS